MPHDPDARWQQAAEVLRAGGLVLLPTDTVYGLAALASDPEATARLFAAKERGADAPVAVLVADAAQAATVADLGPEDGPAHRLAQHYWPGPLTLVLSRAAAAADLALGGDPTTIGVRCPHHDQVRALAAEVGPLATTSANRHGEPTPHHAAEAAAALTQAPGLVIDGGKLHHPPSTVVACTGPTVEVLREGAILVMEIDSVAG